MENQQFSSLPSQPKISSLPGIGNLLNRAWQIYIARIGVFLGIMILLLAVILLIGLFVFVLASLTGQLQTQSPLFFLFIIISVLVGIIIYLWSKVALLYAIKEREQKIGIKEAFARAWSKIISYFWISLLVGFITLVGCLLFIVPGIIFAIWFSLATYILVAEDLTGMKALSRSKQLVSGFWWKVFWRFLVISLIGFAIQFFLSFLASLVFPLFFIPFSVTYCFLIYEDLRKIKEGVIV